MFFSSGFFAKTGLQESGLNYDPVVLGFSRFEAFPMYLATKDKIIPVHPTRLC
jgi:hypothetical protein